MARSKPIETRVLVAACSIIAACIGLFVGLMFALGHFLGLDVPFEQRGYFIVACSLGLAILGTWLLRSLSAIWQLLLQTGSAATLVLGAVIFVKALPSDLKRVMLGVGLLAVALVLAAGMKWLQKYTGLSHRKP